MRSINDGKSRLSDIVPPESRVKLIKLLLTQLLEKLETLKVEFPQIFSDILVITPCDEVEKISKAFDIIILKEQNLSGLNSALMKGISWSLENFYDSSLIIPGDIIDPNSEDIKKILEIGKNSRESMIICPSSDFGTNALFLTLPTKMKLQFGPNSFFEHQKEATKRSIETIIAPLDSLKDDLDTGKDLKMLKTKKPSFFKTI